MLVVLSSIFVANTKIIFVYNFAAPFKKDISETKIETPKNVLIDKYKKVEKLERNNLLQEKISTLSKPRSTLRSEIEVGVRIPDYGVYTAILNGLDVFGRWWKLNFGSLRGRIKSCYFPKSKPVETMF